MRWQTFLSSRVDQAESFAMLIALMCIEEHQHTLIAKVALTESPLVQAMNLWIS